MSSRRLDHDDAYTTRFTARVVEQSDLEGLPAVTLDATYFYPEGGGQEADHGRLGEARVVDVRADGDRVWHVLEGALPDPGETVEAELDWARRFDHMQQHTGQHVLSAGFECLFDAPTQSSHLGESRSTIEVALAETDWKSIARLETAVNAILWEDRPVDRHWTDEEGAKRFALRKPPKFGGRIRIVEIPDWDVSACGGTHTRRTGEVGIVKIVGWEKVRGQLRFEFLCGGRALRDYAWRAETLLEGARRRTISDRELIAHLEQAALERDMLRKRLRDLSARALAAEALDRVGRPARGVADFAGERTREDVRAFVLACLEAGAPWAVAGAGAPEPSIVAGVAKDSGIDLRPLVAGLLERSHGRGGGSPGLIQATARDADTSQAAFQWVSQSLAGATRDR